MSCRGSGGLGLIVCMTNNNERCITSMTRGGGGSKMHQNSMTYVQTTPKEDYIVRSVSKVNLSLLRVIHITTNSAKILGRI